MVAIKNILLLAPFVVGIAMAGNDVNSSENQIDASQSYTNAYGGANFSPSCGRRRRATMPDITGNDGSNINFGNGSNQGNSCRRSELMEEHMEERDIDMGFKALDAIQARGNTADSSQFVYDGSQSTTNAYGGANYSPSCRRGVPDITGNDGSNINFGNGVNQGNSCRRSEELALRDVGAHYRRMVERGLQGQDAVEASQYLRRHAEDLGLLTKA